METNNFHGVEAQAGCQIVIEIGVVHHVQAPKSRNRVMEHMLQVYGEIQDDHADGYFKPVGKIDVVEQSPLTLRSQKSHCNGKNRENQAHREGIEADDHKICKPSARLGGGQSPTRCKDFAKCHHGEDAKETSKAYPYFTTHGKPPVRSSSPFEGPHAADGVQHGEVRTLQPS